MVQTLSHIECDNRIITIYLSRIAIVNPIRDENESRLYPVMNSDNESDSDKEHEFVQTFVHTTVTALTNIFLHIEYWSSMQIYSLYSGILGRAISLVFCIAVHPLARN